VITEAPINPLRRQEATATPPAPAALTATTGVACSSDKLVASSVCVTENAIQSCSETMVPTPVCKSENICIVDPEGVNICMVRNDTLTTDGLIVTIFLLVVFVGGFATLIFLCCRDKRKDKQLRAKKEAALIAKTAMPSKPAPPPNAGGPDPFADRPAH
jgi:hypothetical protein